MSWTCDQIEARITDYLDGAMTVAQEAAFTAHVASCPNCAQLVTSVKSLVKDMRNVEQVEVPPGLVYSILDATLGPRLTPWQLFTKWLRGLATPKFAYGAGSVMATCLIVLGASGTSLRKMKLADLTPSAVYLNVERQAHMTYAKSRKYVMDLRVVYEIQSRLREDENQLQVNPENGPKSEEKQPGQRDDQTHTQPKQQNRANEVQRRMQMLAAEFPMTWDRSVR
ncbi:MAG TPA: zf-HC2 domain-containing protein [Methylomirabilota bacterium]|nr:zf-HC2 domain-containing protein [Methylomirabilota bacterium]